MRIITCTRKKLLLYFLLRKRVRRRRRRRHRFWIRDIFQKRAELGEMNLFEEMFSIDHESFFMCFRMTPDQFDRLLSMVQDSISKD